MLEMSDILKVKELVDKAQDILILTHERPTADSVGSSLALYLGLVALGKKVTVACPDPITVELSGFIGVNKIVPEVHKKNFVISLDYIEGSIEKVSYNIEGDKFNLVIEPRPGFESFSSDKVHYSHVGVAADIVFVLDTIHLGGLKKLYDSDKDLFTNRPVVTIDHHANNSNFASFNLINPSAPTTAEIVAKVLIGLGIQMTEDLATNILNALYAGTNNFQSPLVRAETFELVANCLKSGGKRFGKRNEGEMPASQITSGPAGTTAPILSTSNVKPQMQSNSAPPTTPPSPASPPLKGPVSKPSDAPPEDWLKPKIFKSTNTL